MLIKSLIPLLVSCGLVMGIPAWTRHGTAPGYENGITGYPPEVSPKRVTIGADMKPLYDFLATQNATSMKPSYRSNSKTIVEVVKFYKRYPHLPEVCTSSRGPKCIMEYRMEDPVEVTGKPVTVSAEMCVSSSNPGLNQISSSLSKTITHEWSVGIGLQIEGILSASISQTYSKSVSTQRSYTFQVNPGDIAVMRFTPKLHYVVGELRYIEVKGKVVGAHRADFFAPRKDSDGYAYGTYWLDVLSSGNRCGGGGGGGGGGGNGGFPAECNGLNTKEYGRGEGRGRTGYCCKNSDDCKSSCRRNQCDK